MSDDSTVLVGYLRRSAVDGSVKISINRNAFDDCDDYTTSDGQVYVPLKVLVPSLEKVLSGERAVTTVFQEVKD